MLAHFDDAYRQAQNDRAGDAVRRRDAGLGRGVLGKATSRSWRIGSTGRSPTCCSMSFKTRRGCNGMCCGRSPSGSRRTAAADRSSASATRSRRSTAGAAAWPRSSIRPTKQLPEIVEQSLVESFRSSQVVIDTVNRVFADLPANAASHRVAGRRQPTGTALPSSTQRRRRIWPVVAACSSPSGPSEGEKQDVVTWQFAATHVAELARGNPDRTIGVLVRRNVAVARLIYELRSSHDLLCQRRRGQSAHRFRRRAIGSLALEAGRSSGRYGGAISRREIAARRRGRFHAIRRRRGGSPYWPSRFAIDWRATAMGRRSTSG